MYDRVRDSSCGDKEALEISSFMKADLNCGLSGLSIPFGSYIFH